MKKARIAALLALLFGCIGLAAARTFESAAWYEACTLSQYECEGVPPPVIGTDETAQAQGLLGYYSVGTNVVIVATGLPPVEAYSVLVHEMVHYLQWQEMKKGRVYTRCEAEFEAHAVKDVILKRWGMPEKARNGDLIDYGCNGARPIGRIGRK
jgi:hypothetical protein